MTTSYDPIAEARRLAPLIAAHADETEASRRLAQPVVDALRDAGLFHLFVPAAYGGREAGPVTACQAIEEVSSVDGSAGWCLMIASQNAAFGGFFEPSTAKAVFGSGGILAGVARPIGRAVIVEGGYRVSGRWPFASGSTHATYLAGECVIYDGDTPKAGAHGGHSVMAMVPAADAVIHDTWYTTGLRGTASNEIEFRDVFVPEAFAMEMFPPAPVHPWPLFRSLAFIFVTHGSQAVGVARGAVAAATAIAKAKPYWGTEKPSSEQGRIQYVLAEAMVTVEAAREHMYGATQRLWDALLAGSPTPQLNSRMRLAASYGATSSVRAVDLVHSAMATSAIFEKNPLERRFRDIHTAAAHVMIGPLTYEAAGRVELGLQAMMPFFE
ncbi:MAG: acyl-CoA dehydrogenase family protein [Dehalococcoidia bacterium]